MLIVGDMHVKKNNIDESLKLWDWIVLLANQNKINEILLLGDIFNDFGVLNIEVLNFWMNALSLAKNNNILVKIVVGNHDMSPDGTLNFPSFFSSLGAVIYDKPTILNNYMYVPFIRDGDKFIECVNSLYNEANGKIDYVFCHQEFNGCQFENGFYAPHGANPAGIPPKLQIISGHIHMRQSFGNIFYPGTPRALTKSDANEIKGIHIFNDNKFTFYPVPNDVIPPTLLYEIKNKEDIKLVKEALNNHPNSNMYIDIVGTDKFINDCLKEAWHNAKIKTVPQSERSDVQIKESEGITQAFNSYFVNYVTNQDLGRKEIQILDSMIKKLIPELNG